MQDLRESKKITVAVSRITQMLDSQVVLISSASIVQRNVNDDS